MIGKLLAPYEVYIWAAIALFLLVGSVGVVHHLEDIGVKRQQLADAKLAEAQKIHKEEVEKRAQELMATESGKLRAALVAPAPVSTFAVRVCRVTPAPVIVLPSNGSGGPGSDWTRPPVRGSVDRGDAGQGVDITPDTRRLFKQADAEIAYWKAYYATCVKEGACKAQTP